MTQLSSQSGAYTGDDFARVQRAASARGLQISAAHRHGVMLILTPTTLNDLPTPDQLRQLADDLGGGGVRYVTMSLGTDGEARV